MVNGAGGRNILHIPQPLIANRYTADNATWQLMGNALPEFRALCRKHDIQLSQVEDTCLVARIWIVTLQKKHF